ncbi:MAG: FAD-dependent oxidoreductase [Chitinophagaceae bacterium]|nr:MAG: FAD-dependent oxidoreductase [Chitinophagaceae bacterium]
MQQPHVIIVGAGIAGLFMARELSPHAVVHVLEAQERIGGRIHTMDVDGVVVERGAEFIHGNLQATLALVREAGLGTVPVTGEMYRYKSGRLEQESVMDPHWDLLLAKMEGLDEDMTLAHFLEHFFSAAEYESLRAQAVSFAGGFDLADASQVSVWSLSREWSAPEETNYRITRGYGALVSFLEESLKSAGVLFHTGDAVSVVEMDGEKLRLVTKAGRSYTADKLVVTVPAGVLRKGAIHFPPSMEPRLSLMDGIATGAVIRFVFGFRRECWPSDAMFLFSDEAVPTWWPSLKGNHFQLVGWAGDVKAKMLHQLTEEGQLAAARVSLCVLLGLSADELDALVVFSLVADWTDSPWSAGGYSYATPGSETAKRMINDAHPGLVWFAGESYSGSEHPGTVESAILHAQEIAAKLLSGIRKGRESA